MSGAPAHRATASIALPAVEPPDRVGGDVVRAALSGPIRDRTRGRAARFHAPVVVEPLREAASRGRHGRADTRAGAPALLDYPGCAVVISRDRWFLDRIATHIQVASATGNP
jgi:hypothetical protein